MVCLDLLQPSDVMHMRIVGTLWGHYGQNTLCCKSQVQVQQGCVTNGLARDAVRVRLWILDHSMSSIYKVHEWL